LGNAVSDADRLAIRLIAQELRLAKAENIGVDHDIRVALAGGLSGRPGIVLILGTGASCFGINSAGQKWRSGGWGPLIDDGGSGYWLGIQALHAAVADSDGRGAATQLTSLLKEALNLKVMDELMNRLYAQNMTRTEISLLSQIVFTAAQKGDEVAQAILEQGCELLSECVVAVASKLSMETHPCEVALTGGLTRAGSIYLDPLRRAILSLLPACEVHLAEMSPVLGAGLLALQILSPSLPHSVINNIHATSKDSLSGKADPVDTG
jgi:N-acetylglucosamine kinase-like BadF-type ATPase